MEVSLSDSDMRAFFAVELASSDFESDEKENVPCCEEDGFEFCILRMQDKIKKNILTIPFDEEFSKLSL